MIRDISPRSKGFINRNAQEYNRHRHRERKRLRFKREGLCSVCGHLAFGEMLSVPQHYQGSTEHAGELLCLQWRRKKRHSIWSRAGIRTVNVYENGWNKIRRLMLFTGIQQTPAVRLNELCLFLFVANDCNCKHDHGNGQDAKADPKTCTV